MLDLELLGLSFLSNKRRDSTIYRTVQLLLKSYFVIKTYLYKKFGFIFNGTHGIACSKLFKCVFHGSYEAAIINSVTSVFLMYFAKLWYTDIIGRKKKIDGKK